MAVMPQQARVAYRVDSMRETLIGDKIKTDEMERLLNQRAAEGWTLKTTVRAPVKGRIGPGGADAVILIFERPV